jgi:hypothetical protein
MTERGHFVLSLDLKYYAYANVQQPSGPSVVRVVDSATGKLVATATANSIIGKLTFAEGILYWQDGDTTVHLRIPQSPKVAPRPSGAGPNVLPTTITSEFNALRDQYRKANTPLALAEAQFNSLVAEAQKQKPTTSIDEVKKQHPVAWRAVECARPDFETAHRLLETKLELLVLDLKTATLALDAATVNLQQVSELHKRNAALLSEVNQKRTVVEAAELDVERANRIIKLFESIRSEPTGGLPEGLASSVTEQIQSLGLKLGHEMKTSLDRRYPMRITGKSGDVTIKAGETKLIQLLKPTLAVEWQCGDFKPETIDDVKPFDYVLVEWKADGHVKWACYQSATANDSAPPLERIKALKLKLGHEMKTSLDRRYPMRITGKDGEVTIKAGETKLIELPKPTLSVQWQCGDFNPEAVDDVEPFDYVLVDWKSDGHVTWSCYRSSAASAPTDDKAQLNPFRNSPFSVSVLSK